MVDFILGTITGALVSLLIYGAVTYSDREHYKKHHYNHISTEETLMDATKHLLEGVGDE